MYVKIRALFEIMIATTTMAKTMNVNTATTTKLKSQYINKIQNKD